MCFVYMFASKRWFVNHFPVWLSDIWSDKTKKILGSLLLLFLLTFNMSVFANDLFSAVKDHDTKAIRQLIREESNINIQNEDGNTPLHEAINADFTDGALILIKSGSDTSITNKKGITVFHVAALKGNTKILTALISVVDDINVRDILGNTALHLLAYEGHTCGVRLLIKCKENIDLLSNAITDPSVSLKHKAFDMNSQNNLGDTPLHLAASMGHSDCLSYLLEVSDIDVSLLNEDQCNVLHCAVKGGNVNCIELLLTRYPEQIRHWDKLNQTIFHKAVFINRPDIFRLLTDKVDDIPINIKNIHCRTALWYAAANGNEEFIDLLLKIPDIDVNITDKQDNSPLFVAALYGHDACVKKLVENNANANIKNIFNNTALHIAAAKGFVKIVTFLLCHTSTENIKAKNIHGETILHKAAFEGKAECISALLPYLTADDINMKDTAGRTALNKSAWNGHLECINVLLQTRKATLNTLDHLGINEICAAVNKNHWQCIETLAAAGCNANLSTKERYTALHVAAAKGLAECTRELIKVMSPDSINAKNKKMQTALSMAVYKKHTACIEILLQYSDIDVNSLNDYGKTILQFAVIKQDINHIKMLLEAGAHVYSQFRFQPTALHTAIEKNPECIELLLKNMNAADINIKDASGNTVLHKAGSKGDLKSMKILVNAGADINAKNNGGSTVFHCATLNGHLNVVKYLLCLQDSYGNYLIDINSTDICGNTAYTNAFYCRHQDITDYLIRAMTNISIRNNPDYTD